MTTTNLSIRIRVSTRRFTAALRGLGHAAEIASRRHNRFARQAAKRPEQTALWSAYRAKTRRRNRRRRS